MTSFSERVVLIVRAGNDFGEQLAREFSGAGYRVALNDLLPVRIEKIVESLENIAGVALANASDPTSKLAAQTWLQSVLEAWGRIDVLVFIANVQPADALLEMDEWDWHRAFDQNLTAAFLCAQSAGRIMRASGGGAIVFALAGDASKTSAAYEVAAAALDALASAGAQEFGQHNILVKAVKANETSANQIVSLCEANTKA